jgi:hypothetical protein
MRARFVVVIAAVAVLMSIAITAFAQQPQTIRVRGEIVGVDGSMLPVRARDGDELRIRLADNAAVSSIVKTHLSEIKPGSYIGVSAMPQADGSQRALHVHIFPEPMRGVAEGHFPWDVQAGSTMTNATVTDTVIAVEGRIIMVKYKVGEKKIVVPLEAPIVTYLPGDKAELKPGAKIFIVAAQKQADGTVSAARISVGRDGLTPPM